MQVFYGFGGAGLLWSTWWESVVSTMAREDPESHRLLTETASSRAAQAHGPARQPAQQEAMPWRAFLRNGPMRALAYTHFCNNWCAGPLPSGCLWPSALSRSWWLSRLMSFVIPCLV